MVISGYLIRFLPEWIYPGIFRIETNYLVREAMWWINDESNNEQYFAY
ncbi:uncharacterized protein METZ01_LOCUS373734 [marine metagenome]|uniref:Uncharacterized protein n=1 Tax=marine metagenome TaxID=408172 RepID=A0A382TFG1_9ZZZZ